MQRLHASGALRYRGSNVAKKRLSFMTHLALKFVDASHIREIFAVTRITASRQVDKAGWIFVLPAAQQPNFESCRKTN